MDSLPSTQILLPAGAGDNVFMTTPPRIRLVSFADGNLAYRLAARRLAREARSSGVFSDIKIYNRERVLQEIAPGNKELADFISAKHRGFGYWLWKPLILEHELSRKPEDFEFVAYLDVGCSINITPESSSRLMEYCTLAQTNGALVFHMDGFIEKEWTKRAAIEYFEASSEMASSYQRLATIMMLPNSSFARQLVSTWLRAANVDQHALLTDDLSRNEIEGFRNHRHDQSLWSLATKVAGVHSISDETYHHPDWKTSGGPFPFWSSRIVGFRKPKPRQLFFAKVWQRFLKMIP